MSEIMSSADLTLFPKVALIIFLGVFALVMFRVLTMRRQNVDHMAHLALDDGDVLNERGEQQ